MLCQKYLECLDSPDTAVTSCLLFLEQLHDLSAVREMFSVYLGGGVKSILGKVERVKNVKSIMMTNYVFYQFVEKYSSKYYLELNWPIIQLNDRTFNPIWSWRELSARRSWSDELKQPPNRVEVDEEINPYISAVNSRGEILTVDDDGVRINSKTGKTKAVVLLSVLKGQDKDGNEMKHDILGVAVDGGNNVYLTVQYYKEFGYGKSETLNAVLYVFDEHCNGVKHKSDLNFQFLPIPIFASASLAVNKNKDIVMIGDDSVYVCDVTGQLKYKFKPKCSPSFVDVSENNEIIIGSWKDNTVEIYTEEGNLKTTIKLPAGHRILGVAFHFGISKIIVFSQHKKKVCSYYLHCYSETPEQYTSTCLGDGTYYEFLLHFPKITSHPSGAAAVATRKTILYL